MRNRRGCGGRTAPWLPSLRKPSTSMPAPPAGCVRYGRQRPAQRPARVLLAVHRGARAWVSKLALSPPPRRGRRVNRDRVFDRLRPLGGRPQSDGAQVVFGRQNISGVFLARRNPCHFRRRFSRAPYRITRLPKGVRVAPPTKVRRRRKLAKMTKVQEKKTRFCTVKRAVSLLQAFPQGTYSLAGLQEAKGSSGGLGHGGQPAGALGVSGPLDPP